MRFVIWAVTVVCRDRSSLLSLRGTSTHDSLAVGTRLRAALGHLQRLAAGRVARARVDSRGATARQASANDSRPGLSRLLADAHRDAFV